MNWVGSTLLTDLILMLPWLVLLKPRFFEVSSRMGVFHFCHGTD